MQCKTSIGNNSGSIKYRSSHEVCVYHGVFGYGGWNGVTAIFDTWPKVTVQKMFVFLNIFNRH